MLRATGWCSSSWPLSWSVFSVSCSTQRDAPAPQSTMTVQVSPDTDPAQLRTELTAAVMVPRSWVIAARPAVYRQMSVPSSTTAPSALAADDRLAVGGTVRDDPARLIRSRAIGTKGLIVSLTNRRDEPEEVTVATGAPGLVGQIRAIDAWTEREYTSHDGQLGGIVGQGTPAAADRVRPTRRRRGFAVPEVVQRDDVRWPLERVAARAHPVLCRLGPAGRHRPRRSDGDPARSATGPARRGAWPPWRNPKTQPPMVRLPVFVSVTTTPMPKGLAS